MNRFFELFFIGILFGCMVGCGGGTSSNATPPIYSGTTTLAPASTKTGGSVQLTLSLTTSPAVSTFVGIATAGPAADTATKTTATFNHPIGITTDGTDLYVADYDNNAIRKISIAADGTTANGVSTIATGFNHPAAITMDAVNLYVADSGNNVIKKIALGSTVPFIAGTESIFAGTAGTAGSVDAVGPAARFNQINGITTDGVYLYVSDSNNTIRRIAIDGGAVTTLAGTPDKAGSADGAAQGEALFNQPARLTTDGTYLYVADFGNRTIRRVDIRTGKVLTLAGIPGVSGATDGSGVTATFYRPNGITTDGTYLYVTDSFRNTIRRVAAIGTKTLGDVTSSTDIAVTTLAGSPDGVAGTTNTPTAPTTPVTPTTPATPALFANPIGITTDGKSLYVADRQNNMIRQIQ